MALWGALIKATCNQKSTSGGPFAPHPPTPSDCEMVCLIVTSHEPFSEGELDMASYASSAHAEETSKGAQDGCTFAAGVKRLQWTWGEEQRCNIVGTFRLG